MPTIRLISAPLSLFAKKVEIALAEKGLAFERDLAPFTQTEGYSPRHPEVLKHNPKRQVPVLIHGDLALFDSTVIIEYLEDAFPAPALFPKEPRARARCRLLELFADEILLAAIKPLMHRNEPGAAARPDWTAREDAARLALEALAAHYAKFESELGDGEFLCGAFGAADIAAFLQLLYAQRLAGPSMRPFPRLWTWYRRVKARPSVSHVVAETLAADARLSAPVEGAFKDAP
jgi:glutathione S-transferase